MSIIVAIVDPRPAWCAGLAALLIESGLDSVRRWSGIDEAMPDLLRAPPAILLVSSLSFGRVSDDQMLALKRRTRIVLVLERGVALGDFPSVGIDALLASDASAASVRQCLSTVVEGHAWLDSAILRPLVQRSASPDWNRLSGRQLEVARLAGRGLSNKQIARTLRVSDGTVKIHMHHILCKLGLSGRAALAGHVPEPAREAVPLRAARLRIPVAT